VTSPPRSPAWAHATAFEFRHRFLVISTYYAVGFACYAVDRISAAGWLIRRVTGDEPTRAQLQAVFGFGAAIVAVAAMLRTWASAHLPSAIVHDRALHDERLVADGPYRFVRNPLYLGNLLISVGMGLLASRLGFVVLVLGQAIFYRRLIGREEAELLASQGERYLGFCAAVPRLLPSPSPRLPAGGEPARWGQAVLGEAFFWVFALAQAAFAATLRLRVFGGLLAAAFAIYYAGVAIQRGDR
jgi:protein-S-isoprenylcysteine O-methyltransferase Ste14